MATTTGAKSSRPTRLTTLAFLFPGQGAQFVGMAHQLVERDAGTQRFLAEAEARLDLPLRRLMTEGPDAALQATENAQPAIIFHSLALLACVRDRGVNPEAVAGHSLGEFAGLTAAGGLLPLDALAAVRARGNAMAAAAGSGSGMLAVLGLDDAAAERACAEVEGVVPANYNAPGQVVISGSDAGLAAVTPILQQAGARRLVRLPVSAAFHSPLMAGAAETFAKSWRAIPLQPLRLAQVFNADAEVHADPSETRELMVGQLTRPVRWTQSIRRLTEMGITAFVEIGPGRTLTGLVKKIAPKATVHNIDDMDSLEAFAQEAHA